ncbi:hypothetical protein KIL84_023131 [Mauremys mutica]|uniref:Uncharacterized protein n=1 Tax=Mauremys mutica TaxID=74926 RepID=A0A9D3WR03_9SAUR|nr:hypothetical protein KIL84_023131 [Mauremys mutica]
MFVPHSPGRPLFSNRARVAGGRICSAVTILLVQWKPLTVTIPLLPNLSSMNGDPEVQPANPSPHASAPHRPLYSGFAQLARAWFYKQSIGLSGLLCFVYMVSLPAPALSLRTAGWKEVLVYL